MVEFCEFSVYGVDDCEVTDGEDVNDIVLSYVQEKVFPLTDRLDHEDDILLVRVIDNVVSVYWWLENGITAESVESLM